MEAATFPAAKQAAGQTVLRGKFQAVSQGQVQAALQGQVDCAAAYVTNLQKYSIHDGAGLRTTLFLKGCPLRCFWCANPENREFTPQLMHFQKKCAGCLACVAACPEQALVEQGGRPVCIREKCIACGACEDVCLHDAIRVSGKRWTPREAADKCLRDAAFYRSDGGVTVSGGEPLCFAAFCCGLMECLAESGIGVVFETCGYGPWETLESYAKSAQGIFFDIKHANPEKHRRMTGASNALILENLRRLTSVYDRVTVRVPVIPGLNDTAEEMTGIAACIAGQTGPRGIVAVELLPFHNLGQLKYEALGLACPTAQKQNMTREHASIYLPLFKAAGLHAVVK